MMAFWESHWALAFMLTPCFLGIGGLLSEVQLAHSRHFSSLLHAFRRSDCLPRFLQIWGTHGFISRCMIVSALSGIMLYARRSINRGQLDPKDFHEFPLALKRRLTITSWLIIIGFAWFMFGVGLLNLSKP
ncbi:hypothetical protein CR917_18950 [Pseudomonas sp. BRM28]|nr:hypothetical protein CR917_18950 [Pseudomonas sp. BRM28]